MQEQHKCNITPNVKSCTDYYFLFIFPNIPFFSTNPQVLKIISNDFPNLVREAIKWNLFCT